jgi:hypothetical protein
MARDSRGDRGGYNYNRRDEYDPRQTPPRGERSPCVVRRWSERSAREVTRHRMRLEAQMPSRWENMAGVHPKKS